MSVPPPLLELLFAGESETLEVKERIRDPLILARLIAGFANARGGRILVGVREPPEIVGVDRTQFEKVFRSAEASLKPTPSITTKFIETDTGLVADVSIQQSSFVVLVEGSAFIRSGAMTRPMEWTQIRKSLPSVPDNSSIDTLLKQSQAQTEMLERLLADNEVLKDSNETLKTKVAELADPKARLRERLIGGAIGVAASLIAAGIWLVATKQLLWLR